MVTILGTTFGHGFGNPFCVVLRKVGQLWECDCAQFVTHPCRHDEETNNVSRRAKSNKAARAYQKAWRTALFDLARRDSLVLSVPRAFQNFGDQNMFPASARAEGSNLRGNLRNRAPRVHPQTHRAVNHRGVLSRTKQRARIRRLGTHCGAPSQTK